MENFGLKTKVTYTMTNSPVVGLCFDYALADGEKVKRLVLASPDEVGMILEEQGCPSTSPNGHWRLSLCYSLDRKFAVFHFSEYVGFEYKPIGETRFVEDDDAKKLLLPFVK